MERCQDWVGVHPDDEPERRPLRRSRVNASSRTALRLIGEWSAFAILLFVVRFFLRGHLVPQLDEECTIGGAAVEILAHGIRFPLPAYAPNDYENGFFYSALLAAASFAALGRNVLTLKLPTHLIASIGAVATVWLLRSCLDEQRLSARSARWTAIAVLIVATALSPREVALFQTWNVGLGSHAEGVAIDMVLLAWFARRGARWTPVRTAWFWLLVGLAVHVNRGVLVLLPVLASAEWRLARSSPGRIAAIAGGLLLGSVPELVAMTRAATGSGGWATLGSKLATNARSFPSAFVLDLLALADHRIELLATWLFALAFGLTSMRSARGRGSPGDLAAPPTALGMTLGFLLLHLAGLAVMAQGGIDNYALHIHPPLVVLTGLLAGWLCSAAGKRWGTRAGIGAGAAIVAIAAAVHRPDALTPSLERLSAWWGKRDSAACSWRLGEAFVRVQGADAVSRAMFGTAALSGRDRESQLVRERRAVELCRSLSETPQVLDCIGGVGRDSHFGSGPIGGEPPAELSDVERRAYAFYFGVRTGGDLAPCDEFREPTWRRECRAAVRLDCLIRIDIATRFASGRPLGRPRCDVPEPPMAGYWAEMRSDLLARPAGAAPETPRELRDGGARGCAVAIDSCY